MHRLHRALELISNRVGGDISLLNLQTFLFIAQRGKCTQKDVEVELKVSNAAVSRNVSIWTDRRYDRNPGVKFVEGVQNDYDRRIRELTLTSLGKEFYKELVEVIEGPSG